MPVVSDGFCTFLRSVQLKARTYSEPCDTKCDPTWMMRTHQFMEIVAKLHTYLVDCDEFFFSSWAVRLPNHSV